MTWDEYFIRLADLIAQKSKDRSTKVGVVVVGPDNEIRATGYNGFPRGVYDDIEERHERPAKYLWTEHAERNAVYAAARVGVSLKGCVMYVQWRPILCADCARAVIQAGITTIIGRDVPFSGKGGLWDESLKVGREMLEEAGINLIVVDGEKMGIRRGYASL